MENKALGQGAEVHEYTQDELEYKQDELYEKFKHYKIAKMFPQGGPGTIVERCGKRYLVTDKGMQVRVED